MNVFKVLWNKLRHGNEKNPKDNSSDTSTVILPFNDLSTFEKFAKSDAQCVSKFYLKRLKKAIIKDLPYIDLFRYDNGNKIARLYFANYDNQLQVIIKYFILAEDYENASMAKKLLDTLRSKTAPSNS